MSHGVPPRPTGFARPRPSNGALDRRGRTTGWPGIRWPTRLPWSHHLTTVSRAGVATAHAGKPYGKKYSIPVSPRIRRGPQISGIWPVLKKDDVFPQGVAVRQVQRPARLFWRVRRRRDPLRTAAT